MMQISPRERFLGIGLIAALVAWAIWTMAVKPARERIRTLERILPEKQAQLHDLQAKSVEYAAMERDFRGLRTKLASQDPGFDLPSFLEATIERHKLAGHLSKMQPETGQSQPGYSETVVTIEMQDVTLRQLLSFLTAVEAADAVVQVGSLHIRRDATNEALLDSTLAIYSPHLTSPSAQSLAQAP